MSTLDPQRSAAIFTTAAVLAVSPGPLKARYAICLDTGLLYQWKPGDATATNGVTILGQQGGNPGTWQYVPGDAGGVFATITDSDETIVPGAGIERLLSSLTRNATKTLGISPTPVAGSKITVSCTSGAAFTLAFVNGGPGAGTLFTKPISQKWWATFRFDGTNWALWQAAQMA